MKFMLNLYKFHDFNELHMLFDYKHLISLLKQNQEKLNRKKMNL